MTESTSITEQGWAADARQLNAAVEGTFANSTKKSIDEVSQKLSVAVNTLSYGGGVKELFECLKEIIVESNFSKIRMRSWFLDAIRNEHRVWYTCIAFYTAGTGDNANFSGILLPNWNEDAFLFYRYTGNGGKWVFHKIAGEEDYMESI